MQVVSETHHHCRIRDENLAKRGIDANNIEEQVNQIFKFLFYHFLGRVFRSFKIIEAGMKTKPTDSQNMTNLGRHGKRS